MAVERINDNCIESSVLTEEVLQMFDRLEARILELLKGENHPEAYFRAMITETEVGDAMKYITHDPILNPGVRSHGSREEEVLAHGQVLFQEMGWIVSRGIHLRDAAKAGYLNWEDRDWKKREAKGTDKEFLGTIVYPGKVQGPAFVVNDKRPIDIFPGGDILVAAFLKPAHFNHLETFKPCGIVVDNGGATSHPATLAMMLKVPTVVGVGNASELIPHGAQIVVDALSDRDCGKITFAEPAKR